MGNHIKSFQEQREDASDFLAEDAITEFETHKKPLEVFEDVTDEVKNYYEYIDKEHRL